MKIFNPKLTSMFPIFTTLLVFDFMVVANVIPFIFNFIILTILLVLPGKLLLPLFELSNNATKLESALYTIGLSLTFLLFGGLLLNSIGPLLGISRPLGTLPIVVSFNLAVLIYAYFTIHKYPFKLIPRLSRPRLVDTLMLSSSVLLFISTIVGVLALNGGRSGTIAVASLFGISLYVPIAIAMHKKISSYVYPISIFIVALSLLLSFSLRSPYFMGWDIYHEYYVFQLTNAVKHWSIATLIDPYNACMSITILPSIFSSILKMSDVYIYKIIFQLIFALTPLSIYALASRVLPKPNRRISYLAAILFISQTWFIIQMPALIRQEVALFFFSLILLALFSLQSYSKVFVMVFSAALILSHYSTAYLALFIVIGYLIIRIILKNPKSALITIRATFVLFIMTFLWQSQLTRTSGGALNIFSSTIKTLPQIFTNQGLGSAINQVTFSNQNLNTNENISNVYKSTSDNRTYDRNFYPVSTFNDYVPAIVQPIIMYPKINIKISNILLRTGLLLKILITVLFPMIGIFYLITRRRISEQNNLSKEYLIFIVSCLLLVSMILLLPSLKANYNITRLYLQLLIIFAPLAVIGGVYLLKYTSKFKYLLVASMISLFMLYSSGVLFYFTGGTAFATLTNDSQDYSMYYTHEGEILSAHWLLNNSKSSPNIYVDESTALRLFAFGFPQSGTLKYDVFPSTILKDSYIYAGSNNIIGKNYIGYKDTLLQFTYPNDFIDAQKNLLYSNSSSRIYY